MEKKLQGPSNEEVLGKIKSFCNASFYENVASSPMTDRFYKVAINLSKVLKRVENGESVTIVDTGGGGGKIYDMIAKDVGKELLKKVNYVSVDKSRVQLGTDKLKSRVVGDMMHLPLENSTAHAVFLLNPPSLTGVIEKYIARTKPASIMQIEEDNGVQVFLHITDGAFNMLNVLEGVRVMRDDGIMVGGLPFRKGELKDLETILKRTRNNLRRNGVNTGPIPIEIKESRIIELDWRVMSLWDKYGIDIDWPKFRLDSYVKTGAKLDDWFKNIGNTLNFGLGELAKTDRFWEIMDEMRKEKAKSKG